MADGFANTLPLPREFPTVPSLRARRAFCKGPRAHFWKCWSVYSAKVRLEPELNAWDNPGTGCLAQDSVEASIRQPAYGTRNLNVIKGTSAFK